MPERALHVGILGWFGSGNLGNDGTLEATLGFLRLHRPGADLTCICMDPETIATSYGIAARAIGSPKLRNRAWLFADRLFLSAPRRLAGWLEAFQFMRGFDVLLISGTGVLDDFGSSPWGIPYGLFKWCVVARLAGTKVAFLSVGAGPVHHWMSRWLMKRAASMAQYRSYRDTCSKEFMESIGCGTQTDAVTPDLAFMLPTPQSNRPPSTNKKSLNVGLGVMTYYGWGGDAARGEAIYTAYLDRLRQFAFWLLDQGHSIRLIVGETTDQSAVDDLLKVLTRERPGLNSMQIVREPAHSLHDVMRQMAETDIVVATRFHNIVCALKLAKPTISLGYARKNDVLMADMGLGDFCQYVEEFDIKVLINQFNKLLRDSEVYERRLREMNLAYQTQLSQQVANLLEIILSPKARVAPWLRLPEAWAPFSSRYHDIGSPRKSVGDKETPTERSAPSE